MRFKPVLLLFLFALIIGLAAGILDSFFHSTALVEYRFFNVLVFIVFFIGIWWMSIIYRDVICKGYINYWKTFGIAFLTGILASVIIGIVRFLYLRHVIYVDINGIITETRESMLRHYELYPQELIENRLKFIEFSYDPLVSSILYFAYYSFFALAFAFLIALFVKRVDRNISID